MTQNSITPASEGKILKVLETGIRSSSEDSGKTEYQKLQVQITRGDKTGEMITLEVSQAQGSTAIYKPGDKVVLTQVQQPDGKDVYAITDFVRTDALFSLTILFVFSVIAVSRWRGFLSIIAMCISFAVIFTLTLPMIMSGWHPVFVSIITATLIIPITFYLSHGWSRKTHIAIIGTVLSLLVTSLLAWMYISLGKLSGMSSEEAGFLSVEKQGAINLKNLIMAGVIVGSLGILDDVTVSQVSVVEQLKASNQKLGFGELFKRAMAVGQDHISSMVNTLVLVYAGASLPLLLLFINTPHPFLEIVNYEIIAEEIIKTLVGSIGIVFAAPTTTLIAAFVYSLLQVPPSKAITNEHHH